ncbi:unnamed protein product [Lota lota]
MRVLLLLFNLLRVVESNQQVLGFLGENVTLSPAVDVTRQNISSIKWLILSNDTWIATYQHGTVVTDHFWQYRGRLHLDISSGDLMISNLIGPDAMQYVVEVVIQGDGEISLKFVLKVESRLEQPSITALHSVLANGSCTVALQCSSPDPLVAFTWRATPPTTYWAVAKWPNASSAFLLVSLATDQEVDFICNTTSALESASDSLVVACRVPIQEPTKTLNFGHGVLLGSCLGVLLATVTYVFREKIEAAINHLTNKGCWSDKGTSVAMDET